MREVILDGEKIGGKKELFEAFEQGLSLEEDWGRNLDALADELEMIFEPVTIRLRHRAKLEENLGPYYVRLFKLLSHLNEEEEIVLEEEALKAPPYRLVIFDLDGTLLDTIEDLKNAVNHALKSMNMPERSLEEVRAFVGNGVKNLVHRSVPEGTDPGTEEETLAIFREYYLAHCEDNTCPYPGILLLLRELKAAGLKTAIVSNKNDAAVKKLSRQYFGELIDIAIGENEAAGVAKKPAPDTIFQAMEALGERESCVYIGDSEVDHETALNAGVPLILVSWGFRERELLESFAPEYLADDADTLAQILLGKVNG